MKYIRDFTVTLVNPVNANHTLLGLTSKESLPGILPGQFVQLQIPSSNPSFLRRPFSIHDVDFPSHTLYLLIKQVGKTTTFLCHAKKGDIVNLIFPLGRGFSLEQNKKVLLAGGGCGVAPLLYLARCLQKNHNDIHILLGGRTREDILEADVFGQLGKLYIATEDGSRGEKGLITLHSVLKESFDFLYACGPQPMLKAMAVIAREKNIPCEVSLENSMACGIGACLCCVTETVRGNECVCTEGPVFNTRELKWPI